uniref:ADAM metallopeptidase domain 9a n=1 Tax=Tetraodon nigroviridis TaxID=99883 RepID=H3CK01_TETNG
VDGREHVVRLQRNRLLLPADFTVFSYSQNGSLVTARPPVQNHCHYQGFVENMLGSSVAMSICNGLRGVLHLHDDSYGIEPLESDPDQHLLYRLQDVTSQPKGCGTAHGGGPHSPAQDVLHTGLHKRVAMKRAVLHQTHYVELLLVVDNERVNPLKLMPDCCARVCVCACASIIYIQLNVRVVLVGLEIWTHQNLISTEGAAGEVLSRFTQWREKALVPRQRHDSAQLILKKSFGGTAGMAFVSTVCSRSHSGGINAFPNNNLPAFASIVAHELGHNLGMNHDDGRSCTCPSPACIMNSGTTYGRGDSRNFSSCSADDFEKMILLTGGSCLLNVPHPDEAYSAPYCGNRLVDVGEECDCGSQKECEDDPCCEHQTCRLKPGAQCAYGECCSGCQRARAQYLAGGTVCRSSTDECDLPEYCNGSSSFCQSDVFVQNGQPCSSQQAYCYNGKCQHHDGQCRDIFGSKAKASPEICFRNVNSKGDRFGNCGYQNYGYKKCESRRNALCGKLQCSNIQTSIVFSIQPSIISTFIDGANCYGVDFQLGSDVPDPGMVNAGTKCGDERVCINFECVSAQVLSYDCDVEKKCHGRGVCNSNRNCHCGDGWRRPSASSRDKDTSLRDGLLVFFFLVLPLLALGTFLYLRRNDLVRRL